VVHTSLLPPPRVQGVSCHPPSHLITGRRLMSLPDGPYNSELSEDVDVMNSDISKRMIHLNSVLEHFWRRWKKEYLLELRESHRHTKHPPKESYCCKIAVGDMVLVHERQPTKRILEASQSGESNNWNRWPNTRCCNQSCFLRESTYSVETTTTTSLPLGSSPL